MKTGNRSAKSRQLWIARHRPPLVVEAIDQLESVENVGVLAAY
jgi:hypothetical protein